MSGQRAVCDVCDAPVNWDDAYVLNTETVVTSQAYWEFVFTHQWSYYRESDPSGSSLNHLVAQQAGQQTGWLVCERCSRFFSFDRAEARRHARAHSSNPPGAGSAEFLKALSVATKAWEKLDSSGAAPSTAKQPAKVAARCPQCRARVTGTRELQGKPVQCRECGRKFRFPVDGEVSSRCPHCRKRVTAGAGLLGKEVKCPSCGEPFHFGATPQDEPPAETAPVESAPSASPSAATDTHPKAERPADKEDVYALAEAPESIPKLIPSDGSESRSLATPKEAKDDPPLRAGRGADGWLNCELAFDAERQCQHCGKWFAVFCRAYISVHGDGQSSVGGVLRPLGFFEKMRAMGPMDVAHAGDPQYAFEKEKRRAVREAHSNPPIQRCTHCGLYARSDLELIKRSYLAYRRRFRATKYFGCTGVIVYSLAVPAVLMLAVAALRVSESDFLTAGVLFLLAILLACAALSSWLRRPLSEEDYSAEVEKANDPQTAAEWVKQWNQSGVKKLQELVERDLRFGPPVGKWYEVISLLHSHDPKCFPLDEGGMLTRAT